MTAPTISTTYGPVRGSATVLGSNKTVLRYLGIPFAKAERFEDPVPPDKWTSTLHANKTDKICPQPGLSSKKLPLMSEDCLLLSVYVPGNATSSSSLAVMLWIHGGGYVRGDIIGYDRSVLATEGNVIVVAAAYRLGVFGFLSANSDNLRGNYGMMDQIAAMKWVNNNIARFGGDPNRVTIFGVSAGGMSVALMILSPLASGLYQNVIIQSGSAVALAATLERDEADLRARSFAKAIGCEITSLKECAKKKTVQEVLAAQIKIVSPQNYLPLTPVPDGYFLPDSALKLLQAGKFNKSNIMIGVTKDDGSIFTFGVPGLSNGMPRTLFKEVISNRTWIRNQNSRLHELLIYEYTDWSNATDPYVLRQRFIDMNTDGTFKAPAIQSAKAFVKKQAPTYFYQLEKAPKVFPGLPQPPWTGVYHGADVFYVFGGPFLVHKNFSSVTDMKLGKDIITMWTNFAKTGNPNNPTSLGTTWPQYTADSEEYMGLGPNITVRSKMRPDKMRFWNEFLPSVGRETVKPTTASHIPSATKQTDEIKDNLVMVLAILTGVFGALAVILLVVLIVTCCKRKRRGKDFEEPLNM
ncbi:hypothetical protein ACROYT_G030214 [Oculina patagonica]